MNSVENDIYNGGTICGKTFYITESGETFTKEVIKYNDNLYLFTFLNCEIIDCHVL